MARFRRLLVGIVTIAVAQFGVVATAPAHAHENGDGHGIREIVLSHAQEEPNAHHHDDGDHHGDHEDAAPDPVVGGGGSDPATGDASHGEHAHVHACPQFTPLGAQAGLAEPVMLREVAWPARAAHALSYSSSPPLRPPRAIL